jgi:ATP-dependent Zn protease
MRKPNRLFKDRKRTGVWRADPEPGHYNPNYPGYIAFHEAGHAVSAVVLGFKLKAVDIKQRRLPDGAHSMGFTDTGPVKAREIMGKGEDVALPRMIQQMTGYFAEARVNDRAHECTGHIQDFAEARKVAAVAVCASIEKDGRQEITLEEQERNRERLQVLFDRAKEAAARLVAEYWPAIKKVAALLLEREVLSGDEVTAIVSES